MNKIKVDTSKCLKPCKGHIITSLYKSDKHRTLDNFNPTLDQYDNYKKITSYPTKQDGKYYSKYIWFQTNVYNFLAYKWKNQLKFVRIYFDTQTFDKITKDRAAKFVDMLSAIGGTMGLLTGFSIISAVEIIYFATKIIWNFIKNKRNKIIK